MYYKKQKNGTKKLVPHPHKLVVRNVSHKCVGCTAFGQTFRLMTRWFLLTIEASNLYRSVVGYSINHNHSENFFSGKYMLDWRMYVTFVELLLN